MSPDVTAERLENFCEHSLAIDRLQPGWVLDVGCRDFLFARAMARRGHQVLAMDPARDVQLFEESPGIVHPGVVFLQAALVGTPSGPQPFCEAGNGSHLAPGASGAPYAVDCVTLTQLMEGAGIAFFSAVKLDCEGAEYDVLRHWPGPIADQISVEYHDFLGQHPPETLERLHEEIRARLGQWYDVARHEMDRRYGAGWNYWDSLYLLRERRTP